MSSNLLNPTVDMLENNPEVKSYIYQQIVEFQPFVTPETVVVVMARDPRKLSIQLETDGRPVEKSKLKKMFRIAIVLSEGDAKIEAEALEENVFDAIRVAKENLLRRLMEIQDQIISQSDRIDQINQVITDKGLH